MQNHGEPLMNTGKTMIEPAHLIHPGELLEALQGVAGPDDSCLVGNRIAHPSAERAVSPCTPVTDSTHTPHPANRNHRRLARTMTPRAPVHQFILQKQATHQYERLTTPCTSPVSPHTGMCTFTIQGPDLIHPYNRTPMRRSLTPETRDTRIPGIIQTSHTYFFDY